MSTNQTGGDPDPRFHIEGDAAVLETKIQKIEREQREARERDATYSQAQLTINNQQLRVNTRLMVFTGLLLLTSVLSGSIAIWEAHIAQQGAAAAQTSAKTAQDTFDAITGPDGQFDRQMRQIIHQTATQFQAAQAAEASSQTARDALWSAEGANVVTGTPEFGEHLLYVPIYNAGHMPSGKAKIIIYVITMQLIGPGGSGGFDYVEVRRQTRKVASIPLGINTRYPWATVNIPYATQGGIIDGTQMFITMGRISYEAGMGGSAPQRTFSFCYQTEAVKGKSTYDSTDCDPDMMIDLWRQQFPIAIQ